uniref:DNA topoisomerase 2 n=1 Tax=Ditylum brightwellii TaxID=49249 RepID=A0A7S1Z3I8_9STRA|mmetsp:Transcript_23446/g.34984  ORF Transcript_23446/g.34984 Transcript_23446/m.34984 type:complete len:1561 (+) Transcript_23446:53-4735(+)
MPATMTLDSDSEMDDFVVDSESDFDDDEFDEENIVPKKQATKKSSSKAPKKAAAAKKTTKKKAPVLSVADDNVMEEEEEIEVTAPKKKSSGGKKKTVEQIYQKKSQLEHILLRPDTYIGSVERLTQPMWVLDGSTNKIISRNTTYTPGLYKIFDEILVNAADNKQRDPDMDKLDITIDAATNTISVKNNGKGIPVVMHKEHNCYVPTLIFGHLLTGSNFDDDEKKTTGGRNGYGAKLANIFSTQFTVECVDSTNQLKFHQVFKDNMGVAEKPKVTKCTTSEIKKGDYTKITFSPDLARFGMKTLDEDAVCLLSKRAYDIAGSMSSRHGKQLAVTLNKIKLPIKSFKSYLEMYEGINPPAAYEQVGERWEIGVSVSDGSFQQISFVNAICTSKGGGHVNYIADQVATKLSAAVKKKNKGGGEVKPNQIKNHLCIFVNCLVENPAFDSQTKENMTTRKTAFGSGCTLSEKFMKQVVKSGVVDSIVAFAKFKQGEALKRKGGAKKSKLTGIVKLDDANFAGTAKSKDCTLIITEGDSAKSLAMSGLSVVGRDYYGVFPLKGKPLNVRDASHKQIMGNEEIANLVNIMGLKYQMVYDESNIKNLRYGHLMIMADQDHDGSHIKGLVINFIHHFWPSLLDVPGFLQQFITPIVKATKGKKSKTFFTLPEYETWKDSTGNDAKGYTVKYYKGLGTSTSAEAKDYFSNLDLHEVTFGGLANDRYSYSSSDNEDEMNDPEPIPDIPVSGTELIMMAFSKSKVEKRKTWLNNLKKDTFLNYSEAQEHGVKYSDFINKELILFSQADNQRSIPHVMDGFKPSQRKVLFSCFKRKLKGEIKVAQLAGYIGEHSAYHHGEASLTGTIVNMAQSFVGSNNVNLLTPSGQFGTRRMGGKDAASPRYIFTKLEKITRTIFHPDDDALLTYLHDDGLSIEPEFYMPVIPMVLVNGSEGIGTGWSSNVPNYDPRLVISNLRKMINGEEIEKMSPHYYGFTGEINSEGGKRVGSYVVKGKIERTDENTLFISELPIKKWTQDYKVFLEALLVGDGKIEPSIKDFKENHTDSTVSFTITAEPSKIDAFEKGKDGLYGKFKLLGSVSTTNLTLFNDDGRIIKYAAPEEILKAFFGLRLDYYSRRKALLLENLRWDQKMLSNKARFVEEVCSGELIVSNRKRKDLLADLKERGYDMMNKKEDKNKSNEDGNESDNESVEESASDAELAKGYDYLLGMKIWTLTYEKAEQLRRQLAEKTQAVEELEATSPSKIWQNDLDNIEEALDERDAAMEAADEDERKAQSKSKKRQAKVTKKKATAAKKKKKKKDDWDSDLEDDSSDDEKMNSGSDDDFVTRQKPAASKKRPAQRAVKKEVPNETVTRKTKDTIVPDAPVSSSSVASIDEKSIEDVTARMSLLLSPEPKKVKREVVSSDLSSDAESDDNNKGKKRPSPRALGDFDSPSFEGTDEDEKPAPKKKVAVKKSAAKKAAAKKPAAKKAVAKKPAAKKVKTTTAGKGRGRKKVVVDIESDEDEGIDFDEDDESVASVAPPPRARSARTRKAPVTYAIDDESASEPEESDDDFV